VCARTQHSQHARARAFTHRDSPDSPVHLLARPLKAREGSGLQMNLVPGKENDQALTKL